MTLITLVSLVFALSTSAAAAPTLSLSQAVEQALRTSPRIERAQAAANEASWKKTESLSGFLPSLTVGASHYFGTKYQLVDVQFGASPLSIAQIFPTTALSVNASVTLFDGLANIRGYQAASLRADAGESEAQWAEFELRQEIRLRFYQALATRALKQVAEQNEITLKDHLNQVTNLKRSGVATDYDVLRAEVQLNEATSEIMNTDDNYAMAKRRLALAMGAEAEIAEPEGELPDPGAPAALESVSTLASDSLTQRGDLLAASLRSDAAARTDQASAAFWVPRVTLGAQWIDYNNRTSSITDTANYRTAYNYGLFLTWNLFDGLSSLAKSRQAYYQRVQTEKSLELLKQKAPVDLEFWKRRFRYSASLYRARRSDVTKADESVRLAREGFRAGVRTSTEVLDSELELFRARAGVVNAQMNCIEARINVELGMGKAL